MDPSTLPRVLLVSMPFAALERPSLGLSLLKAELTGEGISCDVRYLAPALAEFTGLDEYLWIQGELPYTAFAGDWTFAASLYGADPRVDAGYVDRILRRAWQLDDAAVARILRIRAYCEAFLDHCERSLPWGRYDVVGFTSTFEQNIPSLALARRVKAAFPEVRIAFGGANWEGEMGQALHRGFDFVDVVCSGEADRSFPAVLRAMAAGRDPDDVAGVVFRRGGESVATGPPDMIRDLDELPMPDYDDYFRDHEASPAASATTPLVLLETSRGCWWGAKQHCTFCGLNGASMTFRSKSADRVVGEIRHLSERYHAQGMSVVDNILDMRYFQTLLPQMEREEVPANLFFEVKANLTHSQVRQLWASGIHHIQPGIESFSDHVLRLMRKGTTALQNVQLLKWCREFGIQPEWNLLYGFPGEDPEDYGRMRSLLENLVHLDPPTAYGPIRLDRFSPYHEDSAGFGMTNVRPLDPYPFLYPFASAQQLMEIAYYFEFDYADDRDPMTYVRPVLEMVQGWMNTGPRGGLWATPEEDRLRLVVERDGRQGAVTLEGWQARLYSTLDRLHTLPALIESDAGSEVAAEDVRTFLRWGVHNRLVLENGGRFLGLAVHRPARTALDGAASVPEPAVVRAS
jgi:ribosomal peptide maturation radical SAM protein 1